MMRNARKRQWHGATRQSSSSDVPEISFPEFSIWLRLRCAVPPVLSEQDPRAEAARRKEQGGSSEAQHHGSPLDPLAIPPGLTIEKRSDHPPGHPGSLITLRKGGIARPRAEQGDKTKLSTLSL
eukprot:scaffold216763_cov34-Tisochrysis_lutea.AAC.2